jgi:hypothetical protein
MACASGFAANSVITGIVRQKQQNDLLAMAYQRTLKTRDNSMSQSVQPLSPVTKALMLGFSVVFAVAAFMVTVSQSDQSVARILGHVMAPFILGWLATWVAHKLMRSPKRSFSDVYIIVVFILTWLTIFNNISRSGL